MTAATRPVTDSAEIWKLTHEQRAAVADLLATLSDEEWRAPSLCAGWSVHDLAGHMTATHLSTPGGFVGAFIGAGFSFSRFSQRNVDRYRGHSNAQLLQEYRDSMGRTSAPPGPKQTWLAEAVIHGEDIARAVGRQVSVSAPALVTVAEFTSRTKPLLHGRERSAGLSLRATDVDWSTGTGPEVAGPAAALIMAMAGRSQALGELGGEGVATLRSRMP